MRDYPSESHSWQLLSPYTACKLVDQTLVETLTTGVPLDIIDFFLEETLDQGDTIRLNFDANSSSTYCELYRKNDDIGRHILKLNNVANSIELHNLKVGKDSIWIEKDPQILGLHYIYTKHYSQENKAPKYRKRPQSTVSQTVSQVRVGQDYFRDEVIRLCNGACVVTKITDVSLLIASHIKPWRESTDEERLDGNNGLLLSPHIDKLFDRHLITFSDDGRIMSSPRLDKRSIDGWGINFDKFYKLTEGQRKYMTVHQRMSLYP